MVPSSRFPAWLECVGCTDYTWTASRVLLNRSGYRRPACRRFCAIEICEMALTRKAIGTSNLTVLFHA